MIKTIHNKQFFNFYFNVLQQVKLYLSEYIKSDSATDCKYCMGLDSVTGI